MAWCTAAATETELLDKNGAMIYDARLALLEEVEEEVAFSKTGRGATPEAVYAETAGAVPRAADVALVGPATTDVAVAGKAIARVTFAEVGKAAVALTE